MHFGRCEEINIAVYPTEPPEVLVFHVRAVAPAEHLNRHCITTQAQVLGYIKFRRCPASLGVPDLSPIDPDIERRLHSVEMYEHFSVCPPIRQHKVPAVGTDRIPVFVIREILRRRTGYPRRVRLERIRNIRIYGRAVALQLPVGGYGDFIPAADIIPGLEEVDGPFLGLADPLELPGAVEVHKPRRFLRLPFLCRAYVRIRHQCTMCRFPVSADNGWIFPVNAPCRRA